MGGFFGVISTEDCVNDLFYGTDYHSHLGSLRAGLMTMGGRGVKRVIHDISNAPFRAKFQDDLDSLRGATSGIGAISDTGDQPIIIMSHLGVFGAVMVGTLNNLEELAEEACRDLNVHFAEISDEGVNQNEVAASIAAAGPTLADGIRQLQDSVRGSCSMLMLSKDGIIAIRDALGRTPVTVGHKDNARAVTFETCALYNLGYEPEYELGPGEAVLITVDGIKQIVPPREQMQICSFLWVYFGFPASTYEGKNIEAVRYECGRNLAKQDKEEGDTAVKDGVVGVPDSGVAHALGYAHESKVPYIRSFVKYTPTWARSFIPREQKSRAHVATMKLIPIKELIKGKSLLFCEDSIVRGTQLGNTFDRLTKCDVAAVHVRSACPPILFNCKYLNFSRSNGLIGLAGRRAMAKVEGHEFTGNKAEDEAWLANLDITPYLDPTTEKYKLMVEEIRKELHLTSLRFQKLEDLIAAIGLPKERLCTYCWDGVDCCACKHCQHGK